MSKPLPDKAQAILRCEDGGHSPWSSVMTVAMSAMNTGWTQQEFADAAMASDFAEVLATENGVDRSNRLAARLLKAWRRAEAAWTPPISDRNDVRQRLAALSQRLQEHKWSGRTGASDRAVALAMVEWGHEIGAWTVDAPLRGLSIRSGVAVATASAALKRLEKLGVLSKDAGTSRKDGHGQRWALALDWTGNRDITSTHDLAIGGKGLCVLTTSLLHPAFLRQALGQTAERVWLDLADNPDATASEIHERLGVNVKSVRRALRRLVDHRLAKESGARSKGSRPAATYQVDPEGSLSDVADEYGVSDWRERAADRYKREREGYREVQRQISARRVEQTKARNANWSQEMSAEIDKLRNPDPFAVEPHWHVGNEPSFATVGPAPPPPQWD